MDLYKKFVSGKKITKDSISGSTVKNYFVSQFLIYCNRFVDEKLKDKEDTYITMLGDVGKQHEANVYAEMYKNSKKISYETQYQGFKLCISEMEKGSDAILNLPLLDLNQQLIGVPDVLEKSKEHESIFGKYHYIVKEIKSSKHFKEKYVMQCAFYNYMIGLIQGYTPEHFYLINRDNETRSFRYKDYEVKLLGALEDIRKIFTKKIVPTPDIGDEMYPWRTYSLKTAEDTQDISLINGIGINKKIMLNRLGVKTVLDMASADLDKLAMVKSLGHASLLKWKRNAEARVIKKELVFGDVKLPKVKTEIYFDFEGTDETSEDVEKMDYMIGCLVNNKYISFIAKKPNEEKVMLSKFIEWLEKFDDYVLYHYSSYEKVALKRISDKYGIKINKKVYDSMFDLLTLVREHIAFPTMSNSLKDVAPYLGFKWRDKIEGQGSILLYYAYLKDKDKKKMEKISNYNEDDCRATKVVKDFLQKLEK